MSSYLVVVLRDDIAGVETRNDDGRLRFNYDDPYRRRNSATPLSLSNAA